MLLLRDGVLCARHERYARRRARIKSVIAEEILMRRLRVYTFYARG